MMYTYVVCFCRTYAHIFTQQYFVSIYTSARRRFVSLGKCVTKAPTLLESCVSIARLQICLYFMKVLFDSRDSPF